MTLPTALLTGRSALMGTSLGSNSGGVSVFPNAGLYWPGGLTPGWPSGDLACYNQHKAMWGRKPDTVHQYVDSISVTSGIAGSAGSYGWITSDMRAIGNDGAILFPSFKYGAAGAAWQTNANALNATNPTPAQAAVQGDFLNFIQNVKRWRDDTGNTAAIKKLIVSYWHEPSNDGGGYSAANGAEYVAFFRAIVDFCRLHGLGGGPKPASGPGSAWAGTWYDVIEWAHIAILWDMRPAIGNYPYYPGDNYVTWVFGDGYNWAGGINGGGGSGTFHDQVRHPGVGQPGASFGSSLGKYADNWKSLQVVTKPMIDWYKAGAGGSRPVNLGYGEFACSEDVDRFTVSGLSLANPQTHTGVTHKKGDWFTGALKFARGEAYTAPTSDNNVTASTDGPLIKCWNYWSSATDVHIAYPNSIPWAPGDSTSSSVSAGDKHYSYDKFVTLVNDAWFTSTAAPDVPVSGVDFGHDVLNAGDFTLVYSAVATPGTNAIASYTWHWGDGTSDDVDTTSAATDSIPHTFPGAGSYTVTLTVADAGGFSAVASHTVVLTDAVGAAVTPYASAPYIVTGLPIDQLRTVYNPALDDLEAYTALGGGVTTVNPSGASVALADPRIARYTDITLTAACTVALPVNPLPGMVSRVVIRQDSGGGHTLAWTHANAIRWPAGTAPTVTATASSSDHYEFECTAAGFWRGRRYSADVR